ncbi:MAG: hypothetical protein ACLPKZ_05170, partial [Acidimicrobiales bacterium]
MSDVIDFEEVKGPDHGIREEIREISDRIRKRRLVRSRVMVTLCTIALAVTAVPLVFLLYQLFKQGLPVIEHTSFFTQLPATPSL